MSVIAPETSEQVYRALGEAVAKHWSRLPHDLQRLLFKQAISSEGERMRPSLRSSYMIGIRTLVLQSEATRFWNRTA